MLPAGVGDRPRHDPVALGHCPLADAGHTELALVLLVELGELTSILAADGLGCTRNLLGSELETAHPFHHVLRPAQVLAELAVVDQVDADLGLFLHYATDLAVEAGRHFLFGHGVAGVLLSQQRQKCVRSHEASHVGDRDLQLGHGRTLGRLEIRRAGLSDGVRPPEDWVRLSDMPTAIGRPMRFGTFIAPFHSPTQNPTLAIERDLELVEWLDELGYDEAWIGEHHSAGMEIIAAPEVFHRRLPPSARKRSGSVPAWCHCRTTIR